MNTIIRNFISVIKRFKIAVLLNIAGLSVAFTAFMLLMMQVKHEWSFDKFHPNVECIFRLGVNHPDYGNQVVLSRPLIDAFIASSPHIKEGALITSWDDNSYFSIDKNGENIYFQETRRFAYPNFASIFGFEMVEGQRNAMEEPDAVLIPESMARKFFGNEPAVGKQLIGEDWKCTVGGVYKDYPNNSVVKNIIYQCINPDENIDQWSNHNYHLYLLLDSPEAKDNLVSNFMAHFKDMHRMNWESMDLRLTWLPDIYYETDAQHDSQKEKGSRSMIWILFSISLLIVMIAGINFTNFTNSTVPMRIKSINTQKILGAPDRILHLSLIVEALTICLISFGLSLLAVSLLSGTWIQEIIHANMALKANIPLIIITGILAVFTGILSGLYPAYYVTSFPPALVLKGSFGLSPSGRKLRNALIGIQFITSFTLIIVALFIFLQNRYMQTSPLGFDTDQIAIIQTTPKIRKNPELLRDKLKNESSIQDVAFAEMLLGGSDFYNGWGAKYKD